MFEIINRLDIQTLLWFNSINHPLVDSFMYYVSSKWVWIPFYFIILVIILRRYGWSSGLLLLICIIGTIACSDQLCASVIRPIVARLRPSNINNPINNLVHIVADFRGGNYSFPSCHAANTFAFATIIGLSLNCKRISVALYIWAFLNSYSRIYLGVHYPIDLMIGARIGIVIGLLFYAIFKKSQTHRHNSRKRSQCTYLPIASINSVVSSAVDSTPVVILSSLIISIGSIAVYAIFSHFLI